MPLTELDGKTTFRPRENGWDHVKDAKRTERGVAQVLADNAFYPPREVRCPAPRLCEIVLPFHYHDLGRDPFHAKEIVEGKLAALFPGAAVSIHGASFEDITARLDWRPNVHPW